MKKVLCPIRKVNSKDQYNYFFGYYDKCPWNEKETKVLCHRSDFLNRFPEPSDSCQVGVIDLLTNEFTPFDTTTAWNWQQGSQLQWIKWQGKECAIYNVREEGKIHARIYDFEENKKINLTSSVYSVSSDGVYASTVNYARLYDCRKDYGISGIRDPWYSDFSPKDDGVYVVNLQRDTCQLIVSTSYLESTHLNPSSIHCFKQRENHVMFNPSGTRFCFMHRYFTAGNIQQSRLFTSDLEGKDIRLLFEGFVSHYDWQDDNSILAWAGKRKLIASDDSKKINPMRLIKKILKPVYYALGKPRILMQKIMGDSYYLIADIDIRKNPQIKNSKRIGEGVLYCDGHCTFSPDRRWILTDGYTDSHNRLPLFLFDTKTNELYEIGRFHTPKDLDGELRIDLHPRFNHDGTKVFIDSGMEDKRDMFIVDVSQIINN